MCLVAQSRLLFRSYDSPHALLRLLPGRPESRFGNRSLPAGRRGPISRDGRRFGVEFIVSAHPMSSRETGHGSPARRPAARPCRSLRVAPQPPPLAGRMFTVQLTGLLHMDKAALRYPPPARQAPAGRVPACPGRWGPRFPVSERCPNGHVLFTINERASDTRTFTSTRESGRATPPRDNVEAEATLFLLPPGRPTPLRPTLLRPTVLVSGLTNTGSAC